MDDLVPFRFFCRYHEIPMKSPGLLFVQRAFLVDLFSGELIFFGVEGILRFHENDLDLTTKNKLKHKDNSLKQLKTVNANSPWPYIQEGLLSEGFVRMRSDVGSSFSGGLIFGEACFWRGLLSEFYGIYCPSSCVIFIHHSIHVFLELDPPSSSSWISICFA